LQRRKMETLSRGGHHRTNRPYKVHGGDVRTVEEEQHADCHWLSLASPMRERFFGPLGVTGIRTFVDPQKPTRVGVLMEVPDMAKLTATMGTPAATEAMAHDGVLAETPVILIEA